MAEQVYDLSSNNSLATPVDLSVDILQLDEVLTLFDIGNDIIIVEPVLLDSTERTPYQWAVQNGYEGDEETFYSQWLLSLNSGGGSEGGIFTNPNPTDVTIGGLLENTVIQGKSWQEIIAAMIYKERFPTLINPSFNVIIPSGTIFEVADMSGLSFYLQYNSGSITPAYGTTGLRSGSVVKYMIENINIPYHSNNQLYTYNPEAEPVMTEPCTRSFTFQAVRLIGPQPLSNKGNNYGLPYPAGSFVKIISVDFVYPWYSSSVDFNTYTKMPLDLLDKEYFETEVIEEDLIGNKQYAVFSSYHSAITGIKQYNTFSGTWEWINGSKENSLLTFDISIFDLNLNGINVSYKMYKHNGPTIGNRKLRFYTT